MPGTPTPFQTCFEPLSRLNLDKNRPRYRQKWIMIFFSILSHNLGRSSGHHRWICNNSIPSWPVFSCLSWAGKVHSCPLFDIVFPSLLPSASFSFSFTVPCRIVFAKPEDLETWQNHLSFRFLTRVRSSSYSNGCLDLSANLLIGNMVLIWNVQ